MGTGPGDMCKSKAGPHPTTAALPHGRLPTTTENPPDHCGPTTPVDPPPPPLQTPHPCGPHHHHGEPSGPLRPPPPQPQWAPSPQSLWTSPPTTIAVDCSKLESPTLNRQYSHHEGKGQETQKGCHTTGRRPAASVYKVPGSPALISTRHLPSPSFYKKLFLKCHKAPKVGGGAERGTAFYHVEGGGARAPNPNSCSRKLWAPRSLQLRGERTIRKPGQQKAPRSPAGTPPPVPGSPSIPRLRALTSEGGCREHTQAAGPHRAHSVSS